MPPDNRPRIVPTLLPALEDRNWNEVFTILAHYRRNKPTPPDWRADALATCLLANHYGLHTFAQLLDFARQNPARVSKRGGVLDLAELSEAHEFWTGRRDSAGASAAERD